MAELPAPVQGVCGVDIGGTGCRVLVQRLQEPGSAAIREGGGIHIGAGGVLIPELLEQVQALVRAAAAEAGVDGIAAVAVGSASLMHLVEDHRGLHRSLAERMATPVTIIASDMVTSHIGALNRAPGAVLAAGTGTVALGTDFAQIWHRVDGWGHLLGDAGGGAWIGRHGLEAGFRALDGRSGGSEHMLERLRRCFGSPEQLVQQVYTRNDRAAVLASFVPAMAELAAEGDADAAAIFDRAGIELASTAAAALPAGLPPRLALVGGLFSASAQLRTSLHRELEVLRPDAELVEPAGSSLDGALLLAVDAAHEPAGVLNHPPFITSVMHKTLQI